MKVILVIVCALLQTGCATYLANQHAQYTSPVRVHAIDGGAVVAVNLFELDAVKERPVLHTVAALTDLAALYGGYRLGEEVGLWGNRNGGHSTHHTAYTITGNTGPVQIGDRNTSTQTTTTHTPPPPPLE